MESNSCQEYTCDNDDAAAADDDVNVDDGDDDDEDCLGDKCKSVLVDNRLHLNPLPGFHLHDNHHDQIHHDADKYDGISK